LFDLRVLKHRPKFVEEAEQPEFVGEGELKLRDYQLQGLNWLNHAWTRYGRQCSGSGSAFILLSWIRIRIHFTVLDPDPDP
jgi:hypothetical protein